MNPVSAFVVFVMIWWTVIFCVLPLGLSNEYEEHEEQGNCSGAPKTLNMKNKLILTTVISFVLWLIVYAVIVSDIIDFRTIAYGEMK